MSVVILFVSLVWKGRGEMAYSDGVSHKRRFVFLKIDSIYHRYTVINCVLLKRCSQDKGEKFF